MTTQSFCFKNKCNRNDPSTILPPPNAPVVEVFLRLAAEGLELQMASSSPVRNLLLETDGWISSHLPTACCKHNDERPVTKEQSTRASIWHFNPPPAADAWDALIESLIHLPLSSSGNRSKESTGKLGNNCWSGYFKQNKAVTRYTVIIPNFKPLKSIKENKFFFFLQQFVSNFLWINMLINNKIELFVIIPCNIMSFVSRCSFRFPVIFQILDQHVVLFHSIPSSHGGCLRAHPNRRRWYEPSSLPDDVLGRG